MVCIDHNVLMSHEEAVAIDTTLAELWERQNKAAYQIGSWKNTICSTLNLQKIYRGNERVYGETLDEALDLAHAKLADDEYKGYNRSTLLRAIDSITEAQAAFSAARDEARPLEALYNEHQWSRFFLVKNNNGHIHSSMNCSTCYHDTRFGWLPTLSGLTEAEAVEEHGSILCSVCYPSAPVEWTNGISKQAQAEKDERAAAKAARDEAKAAKAITNPDGSPLRFTSPSGYAEEIKTLVTAQRELTSAFKDMRYYPNQAKHYYENAVVIAAAIAHKTGADQEELLLEAERKAAKILKKEGWA